jgi:hypothetical protein
MTGVKDPTLPFTMEKIEGKSRKLVKSSLDLGFSHFAVIGNDSSDLILDGAGM